MANRRLAPSPLLPFSLLLVYVAVVYLRPFEYAQYAPMFNGVPLLPILMGLMLLAWLPVSGKRFDAPQYPLIAGLLVCIPLSLISGARWLGGALNAFVDFIPIVVLFIVAATLLNTPRRLRQMFAILAIASTIIAWHGIDQATNGIGWSGALPIQERITYVGILGDPNDLAMAFLIAIPMTLSFVRRDGSRLLALAGLGATCVMLYAVYLTNSRGAILGLAVMLGMYSLLRFGWRRSTIMVPVLFAALVVGAPDRAGDLSAEEASASGRIEAWYAGVEMLKSYPLFGVGRGQFVDHHERTAHNSFVLAAAELGIVGYFFWFSLVAFSVMMLVALAKAVAPPELPKPEKGTSTADSGWTEHQRLARILLYSFIGCMTASFFLSRSYIFLIYLPMAMILGLHQSARARWPSHLSGFKLRESFRRLALLEIASLVFLWLLTRVLLAFN